VLPARFPTATGLPSGPRSATLLPAITKPISVMRVRDAFAAASTRERWRLRAIHVDRLVDRGQGPPDITEVISRPS